MDIICEKSSRWYDLEGAMKYKTLQCFMEKHRDRNVIIRNIIFTDRFFDVNPHES